MNWEKRDSGIPANSYPDRIYFYNSRIGFAYQSGNPNVYKTTDAGANWDIIFYGGFAKLQFADSLNGFKAAAGFFRTTDGGINWSQDSLPDILGNTYTNKWIGSFIRISNNIIYCSGGYVYYYGNGSYKATIYKTTNGGLNWGYQIPDTSYNFFTLTRIFSFNKNNVWIYSSRSGVYSSTGGDTTIYVGINQVSSEIPNEFELYQNYPNPFNQLSIIQFKVASSKFVKLVVYDLTGKEVKTLVNGKYQPGTYQVSFDAEGLSSGVYFYSLSADGNLIQTKKLVLLK